MNKILDYDDYIDKRVQIKYTDKPTYRAENIIGLRGTVTKTSSGQIGVLLDDKRNLSSSYGIFWFDRSDLKILESEDISMTEFKNVAIVNLLEDRNKTDYAFALYDEDIALIDNMAHYPAMVVVNAKGKDNRVLGIVKEFIPVEDYKGVTVTAQVVGVVNMDGYDVRVNEEERLKELAKKKAAIEKELKAEIDKINNLETYEKMAKDHPENPRLSELVAELKGLGV